MLFIAAKQMNPKLDSLKECIFTLPGSLGPKFRISQKSTDKVSARTLVSSEGSTERVHIVKFTHSIVGRTHPLNTSSQLLIPYLVSSQDSHLLELRPIRPDLSGAITALLGYSTLSRYT